MTTTDNDIKAPHSADTEDATPDRQRDSRSVSVRSLLVGGGCALGVLAVVGVIGTLGWQLSSTSSELDQIHQKAANDERAEQVSLNYATGAADMDFQNPEEWTTRLTAGTSPELTSRLQQAASSMQQLIVPLQWTSTASPIAATVESEENGIYEVTTFVNVVTKNLQAPDGIESTATYKMSIDSTNDWQITQISGIGSSLTPEGDQAAPAPIPAEPAPAPAK
jgi:Mce-associated membrane protein